MKFIVVFLFCSLVIWLSEKIRNNIEFCDEAEIDELKGRIRTLTAQKETLSGRISEQEQESSEVYTLYELTRDVSKTLSEEEALDVFRRHLSRFVSFEYCDLLEIVSRVDVDLFNQGNGNRKIYKIQTSDDEVYLAVGGVHQKIGAVDVLVRQFTLAFQRIKLYQKLEALAKIDSLTGVSTRRTFLEQMDAELVRSKIQEKPLACLMLDVDFFKKINDEHGHLVGDQVLKRVAKTIQDSIRGVDLVGRLGGEEFCVVLVETDQATASQVAERIRKTVSEEKIDIHDAEISMTISIGLSFFPEQSEQLTDLIDKADIALYKAKRAGRNRVIQYS